MNNKQLAAQLLRAFLLLFLFTTSTLLSTAYSQNVVTGRVVDKQKKAVYPVAVSVEGTTIGEYTDEKGEYKLT